MRFAHSQRNTGFWTSRVPAGAVKLNLASTLSDGIQHCVLFREFGVSANLGVSAFPATWSGAVLAPSAAGISARTPTAGNKVVVPGVNALGLGSFTVAALLVPNQQSGAFWTIFEKSDGASNREIGLWGDTSNNFSFLAVGGNATSISGGGGNLAIGQPNLVVLTFDVTTGFANWFGNGINFGNNFAIGAPSVGSPAYNWNLGVSDSAGGTDNDNSYVAFYTWSRVLAPSEVRELTGDPFGMLVPRYTRLRATATGGSGVNVNVTGAGATAGAGTLAVSESPHPAGAGATAHAGNVSFSSNINVGVAGAGATAAAGRARVNNGTTPSGAAFGTVFRIRRGVLTAIAPPLVPQYPAVWTPLTPTPVRFIQGRKVN